MTRFHPRVRHLWILLSMCAIVPSYGSIITAQDLTALNPTEIIGSLSGDPNDAAVFKIPIFAPGIFSATTVDAGAFGIPDTVLSLFDLSGNGIFLNDDISGADTFSAIFA